MGTWRCCVGTPSSVSTRASFLSIPLPSVRCSLRPTWRQQNPPTDALVFCLLTRPLILPRSLTRYIFRGTLGRSYLDASFRLPYCYRFPERDKIPDFDAFSSLLRITAKYEMPAVRPQLLKVVRDAYPETFEGVTPTKSLGESVFSGPTPHPNEVLNLFIQQNVKSALPMAYYMAARRGVDSLMDGGLPRSATLSPEVLQTAIKGLIELREMERDETHRLIFGPKGTQLCSESNCPSRGPPGPGALETYKKVFDHIVGSSQQGTKVLQVPEFYRGSGGSSVRVFPDICRSCVERWESGHAELRKRAWVRLPDVFGLES